MTRSPILPVAALALLLAFVAPALAGAHKCTVDGKTVYQDHPCANLAPVTPVVAPAAVSAPPRVQRSVRQVHDELQMAQRHERELKEAQARENELARTRLAGMDAKARQLEEKQIEARWQPRIRAERQKVDRLQAELLAACSGDAGARAECSGK